MLNQKLTTEIITAAIDGFKAQKVHIDAQLAELRGMLNGNQSEPTNESEPKRGRRKMSAAGRKRIAEAQRKRWAESRKQAGAPEPTAKPKRRRLTAAGGAAIVAAAKKRWATKRADAAVSVKTSAAAKTSGRRKGTANKAGKSPGNGQKTVSIAPAA